MMFFGNRMTFLPLYRGVLNLSTPSYLPIYFPVKIAENHPDVVVDVPVGPAR
jgi:hypothetical protein